MNENEHESNVLAFPNADEFGTVKELAARYRTSPPVVFQWIAEKKFPENVILRLGRKILIHWKNLEAFEANGGTTAQTEEKKKAA